MNEFNIALLGKWCWRTLVDTEGSLYKVLRAKYGERGILKEVGR